MNIAPALLEDWLREYYFAVDHDLGSSGVENFSWRDLRRLTGLADSDLDVVMFNDSHTMGAPSLRQAVADRWAGGDAARVMVTHGSSEAMYLAIRAIVQPGDEVVALTPCYQPLSAIAEGAGANMKRWRLRAERQYEPDLDEFRALVTDRTRLVILNFPHNPTGATLTAAQLSYVLDIVSARGAYLLWDAAFAEMTLDGDPLPDPSATYDRCVTLGTLSKTYGLPGLRVGWCIGAPALLDQCMRWRDYITLHLSPLVEMVAERAIRQASVLLAQRVPQVRTNLRLVADWVDANRHAVSWVRPHGGVSSFVRLAMPDVTAFCRELAVTQRVLLCPGVCFGDRTRVRLGFGSSTASVEEGLARIGTLLNAATASAAAVRIDVPR